MSTITHEELQAVLNAAATGYMHDAYGDAAWEMCARFLLRRGHSPGEAAAIMLSKHMRWADDAEGHGHGHATNSAAFKRYYKYHSDRNGQAWWLKEGRDLADATYAIGGMG